MKSMLRHPLSALFSRYDLEGKDLQDLADDIKANGQLLPITICDTMILDGWNRYQACGLAKVKPVTMQIPPDVQPWAFVKGANMLRRHMAPAERVAVMLLKMQMEAKEGAPLVNPDKPAQKPECPKSDTPEVFKIEHPQPTAREIQKDLEVSLGTAHKASMVAKAHDPALTDALADKRISLERAAELAKLSQEERKAAMEAPQPKPTPKPVDDRDARISQLEHLLAERDAEIARLTEAHNETLAMLQAATSDNESMERVINSDGTLTAMMAENKRFREENRVLTSRNNGLMTGNADLARTASSWKRKFEDLNRKTKGIVGQGAGSEPEDSGTTEEEAEYNAVFGEAS